jgi:hypothetical protein
MANKQVGKEGFIWWVGVVEDRQDPLFLGRVRVRIVGEHTENKQEIPTEHLPWASYVVHHDDGNNVSGLKEGDWVVGFHMDGLEGQKPCIMGKLHGIPEDQAPLDIGGDDVGFYDPTPDDLLECGSVPRPPEMCPVQPLTPEEILGLNEDASQDEEEEEDTAIKPGRFGDPAKLPGTNSAFGVLAADEAERKKENQNLPEEEQKPYKFDLDLDGKFSEVDADLLNWDANRNRELDPAEQRAKETLNFGRFVGYFPVGVAGAALSRYPLSNRLNESTVSRLARNEEELQHPIVELKKGDLASAETASHINPGFGTSEASLGTPFEEPETPYDAKYPHNKVYESESGHAIEIDDTPGKERLHRYHRSGTFEEIHPIGTRVSKIVDDNFQLITKNHYHHTLESTNITADTDIREKALASFTMQSGTAMNMEVGGKLNQSIGEDKNVIIKGDGWTFIAGEKTLYIDKATKVFIKDKLSVKAEGDIAFESGGNMMIKAAGTMQISSSYTDIAGPSGGAQFQAQRAMTAMLGPPATPLAAPPVENDAEKFELEEPITATIQPGFILDAPKSGDLYKPISESDGNLVCLSESGEPIRLYHAVATGELEEVTIEYLHEDLTIVSWTTIRPQMTFEDAGLIEEGRNTGELEGRSVWRFEKPGREYPKQMIMTTGSKPDGWVILDSAVRHD